MKTKPLVVDISIDFDFFIRTDPMWDLMHKDAVGDVQEQLMNKVMLWQARYLASYDGTDLATATAIETYADFTPEELVVELSKRGLSITADRPRVCFADSHRYAFEFFKERRAPDMFINLDAHHDLWPVARTDRPDELACGTWGCYLYDHWMRRSGGTLWRQIYPKWVDPKWYPDPARSILSHSWEEFSRECLLANRPLQVRSVMLVRSPEWVPPHHDARFFALAHLLGRRCLGSPTVLGDMMRRPEISAETVRGTYLYFQSLQSQAPHLEPLELTPHANSNN